MRNRFAIPVAACCLALFAVATYLVNSVYLTDRKRLMTLRQAFNRDGTELPSTKGVL
mgnify:CR=1 FL=1